MSTERHLTDAAILEMLGGRLSAEDVHRVSAHLGECASCTDRYERLRFAHAAFERLAEAGPERILRSAPSGESRPLRWLKPALASLAVVLSLAAYLLSSRWMPSVRAGELLASAMEREDSLPGASLYKLRVGDQTCARGRRGELFVAFDSSTRCARAMERIRGTAWSHGNPLSARTYAGWRASLRRHRDRVTRREAVWEIATATDDSPVREAVLDLNAADCHTTRLTLDFDGGDEVSISEDAGPLAPRTELANPGPSPEIANAHDPSDLLEVAAWTELHELHADSGWEAMVERAGSEVRVTAVAGGEERSHELETGFGEYPAIRLDVHGAARPTDRGRVFPLRGLPPEHAPGLAERWLESEYPGEEERGQFSNRTMYLSQQVLGRAFVLDRMRQRETALARCACSRSMVELLNLERLELLRLEGELADQIRPLIGTPGRVRPLAPADARRLDSALGELLSGSEGPDPAALDRRIRQVRTLL